MKVIEFLDKRTEPLISFEVIPPMRGSSVQAVYDVIDQLIVFKPPFIDVTSLAADAEYLEQADGSFLRQVKRKRPGTIGLSAAIKYRYNIETVFHLLCRGFTREETEDALIELNYLGIENILAIRGDETRYKKNVNEGKSVNESTVQLVEQISRLNRGKYLHALLNAEPTSFCIGVGGYPEKHFEAPSLDADIRHLKRKTEAGAEYIVSQMFFNNQDFFHFSEKVREAGITVPIIPGIKVLTRKKHLHTLPSTFAISLPDDLVTQIQEAKNDDEVRETGIRYAQKQAAELMEANVPCLHFYVMNDPTSVSEVVRYLRKL